MYLKIFDKHYWVTCRGMIVFCVYTIMGIPACFFLFFLTSLLEYDCFTMVFQFLVYNKVNQLYIYICSHISSLLHLPPSHPPYPCMFLSNAPVYYYWKSYYHLRLYSGLPERSSSLPLMCRALVHSLQLLKDRDQVFHILFSLCLQDLAQCWSEQAISICVLSGMELKQD